MRRVLLAFAAAIAVTLMLSSCSNGDDESSTTTTARVQSDVATTLSDDPYCQVLQRLNERYGRIDPGLADPPRFRAAMQDAIASAQEAQANAPPELKGDLATMTATMQQLLALFEQVNFDLTKLPEQPQFEQLMSNPEFLAAGQRVQAYTQQNCL